MANKKTKAQNRNETALVPADQARLLALMPTADKGFTIGNITYKMKKLVTVPHLKHEEGTVVGIIITGKIYTNY